MTENSDYYIFCFSSWPAFCQQHAVPATEMSYVHGRAMHSSTLSHSHGMLCLRDIADRTRIRKLLKTHFFDLGPQPSTYL